MADVLGKKISELAETTDLAGLYTIGSDRNNQSKKVPLQFVKEAADYANAQGDYAKGVGDTIQGNTGVNEYPAFSSSTQYAAGSVVCYNNKLYRFTALHPAGAWVGTDAIETSIKAETDVKLTELESESEIISASRPIAEGDNGNMIPYDSIIDNYYYDATTGIKTYSANWKCTPMIPIKPNTLYAKSVILQINEFDKDFNHIRYIAQADASFTSSENAAYVTGSFINQFKETARFNEGETLNDWVEGKKLFLIEQISELSNSLSRIESTANRAINTANANKELLDDMLTSGVQLFNAQSPNIITGEFINYDSGEISNGASYEWLKIAVDSSKGYTTTSGATNLHIAFFNSDDNYISGVLVSWNEPTKTFAIPANAALMSISVRIADASALMVEYGQSASVYTPYSQVIKESYLPKVEGKREIFVAKGQSILAALKKYATDVRVIVESGVYDMVAEYKAYYGADFFAKYDGYAKHYDDLFYAGYYLGDGVELIGQGDVTIQFNYNEGSKDTDSASPVFDAVAQYFSPINPSQNNIVRNINVTIGYDYSCRYHVHDDFATKAGSNVFQNMTLRGRSSKFTSFGCGMGTANTYILENICILTGDGYSISYHNSSSAGKNKLIIKDCYCEGNIMARMMGPSIEKTEVLVSGCKAAAIVLNFVDQENQPNENMELIQWNNIVG